MDVDDDDVRANALLQEKRYREAAQVFFAGCLAAHARGADLHFRMKASLAAKSWILAGEPNEAWNVAGRILEALVPQGRQRDALSLLHKIVEDLRAHGFHEAALGVSTDASRALGASWIDDKAPRLPPRCSQCGAPVRPEEVVRPTPVTVACRFCGASLA